MAHWYKHYIIDWMDGTESLSHEAYRAYHVICQLIYLHEGPIALNEHGIAGRARQSVRAFRKSIDELVATKKIEIRDGKIWNTRCESEIDRMLEHHESARRGGIASGQSRARNSVKLPRNSVKHPRESLEIPNNGPKPLKSLSGGEAEFKNFELEETRLDKKEEERKDSLRESKRKRSAPFASSVEFGKFWDAYPHKVGKPDAELKLETALKSVTLDELMAGLQRYIDTKPADRPWCNPATWLNQQRWLDQPALPLARAPPNGVNGHASLKDQRRQEWNDATAKLDEAIARRRAARDGSSEIPVKALAPRSGD